MQVVQSNHINYFSVRKHPMFEWCFLSFSYLTLGSQGKVGQSLNLNPYPYLSIGFLSYEEITSLPFYDAVFVTFFCYTFLTSQSSLKPLVTKNPMEKYF